MSTHDILLLFYIENSPKNRTQNADFYPIFQWVGSKMKYLPMAGMK